MPPPTIQVLGVYRLDVTAQLFALAMESKFPHLGSSDDRLAAEDHVRAELSAAVLVEALVTNRDERFTVDDFGQTDSDQAPYSEVFLSTDGAQVIGELDDVPQGPTLRVVFFLHYLNPLKPLNTSYGPVALPVFARMPQRLSGIVRYAPVT